MGDSTHTNLVELLSWIVVELNNPKPDLNECKKAAEKALELAAKGGIKHQVTLNSVKRMSQIWGE